MKRGRPKGSKTGYKTLTIIRTRSTLWKYTVLFFIMVGLIYCGQAAAFNETIMPIYRAAGLGSLLSGIIICLYTLNLDTEEEYEEVVGVE